MLTTQRLTALLLTALAPLAVAGTSAAQVPGPAMARTTVQVRVPSHRSLPARYPARRKALPMTVWVPGHEVERTRRVWIPGRTRQEWVAPLYETRYDACGRPYTVCVRPGHWRTFGEPGHYGTRVERVWVPGRWERRFRRAPPRSSTSGERSPRVLLARTASPSGSEHRGGIPPAPVAWDDRAAPGNRRRSAPRDPPAEEPPR